MVHFSSEFMVEFAYLFIVIIITDVWETVYRGSTSIVGEYMRKKYRLFSCYLDKCAFESATADGP